MLRDSDVQQVLSALSHDFSAPFRSLSAWCSLLFEHLESVADARSHRYMEHIRSNTCRVQSMIAAVSRLSEIEAREFTFSEVPALELVQSALRTLRPKVRRVQANIVLGELPVLTCDVQMMTCVFETLLDNAIKFRREPCNVAVSSHRVDGAYEFVVADNGIGFPKNHDSARPFELFGRFHNQEEYPGLGVGLTIAKWIVHRHLGAIWIDRSSSEGAALHFTVPGLQIS